MGKRYYCDYCDRSFKDDYEARKKHICSSQHISIRLEHYRQFIDPEDILKEESDKIPCKKLMSSGECAFGNNCRFSHFTPRMIWELQRICAWRSSIKTAKLETEELKIDEILHEYFQSPITINNINTINPVWKSPLELQNYSNLPPSLLCITPGIVADSNFTNWGH